jgi:cobalt-zinc-cadmium efflux system membrane fusion protein
MRFAAALATLAALGAACNRPAETVRAEKGESRPAASNEVTLGAAARKQSGVVLESVRLQSVPQVLRSTARLTTNENQTWRVGATVEGRVVKALANPGDRVAYGQVLARMHSHDIHESRATYRKAVAEAARLRSNEASARKIRDRARRLYDLKAGSLEQLELSATELRNAETAARNAQVELDRAKRHLTEFLGIPADDNPEDEHAGENSDADLIPVRAPASGIVLTRSVTPGTVVTAAGELFVISDLSSLWAIADVNEEHLRALRPGMPVRVFVQAYPDRPFAGRIGKLGEALDPATRMVRVRVDVPNPAGMLKPEMYATAEIDLGGSATGLFVPAEAPQELRGQTVVFVCKGEDRFEARPVEIGPAAGGAVQVTRGLRAGDQVASYGSFILKSEFLKATLSGED